MADTAKPDGVTPDEAALHAAMRELAARFWTQHGIRVDHVHFSWRDVSVVLSDRSLHEIDAVSITSRTYQR